MTEDAATAEAADPYCLRAGEAAALLHGHPWRRFVVLGDSIAEGVGDPSPGYRPLRLADRVAAELRGRAPDLVDLNLGQRNLRAAEVRARQLPPALAFGPDLALVVCGANDALRPRYDPEAVDRELEAIVTALRERGAEVITFTLLAMTRYSAFPTWFQPTATERMRLFGRHCTALARRLGTIHADMSGLPLDHLTDELLSADGLHPNLRSQAMCAAGAVLALGARLGNGDRVTARPDRARPGPPPPSPAPRGSASAR